MLTKQQIDAYIVPLTVIPTSRQRSGAIDGVIQCVLFDIYGTLFISGSGDIGITAKRARQTGAIARLIDKYRIAMTADALLDALYAAIAQKHHAKRRRGVDFPEVVIEQIWKEMLTLDRIETIRQFAAEFELIVNPVYPMPHLNHTLADLATRGCFMGIISNAQFYTPLLFEWFLGSRPEKLGFSEELIFYSYRYGHAKPSSFMFDRAIEALDARQISPETVLFVGNDMKNDIYPARRAGMKTALFAGDSRSLRMRCEDPCCRDLTPDIVITDLIQLTDLFRTNVRPGV